MKRVTITFEQVVELSEGLQQMITINYGNFIYSFDIEDEEVDLLIDELNELEISYKKTIADIS